jgi:hypothetical protein
MKRVVLSVLGVLAVLVGLGFVLPALAKFQSYGLLLDASFFLLGAVTVLGGLGAAVFAVFYPPERVAAK